MNNNIKDVSIFDELKSWSGEYVVTFGVYKNRQIKDIPLIDLDSYLGYLEGQHSKARQVNMFIFQAKQYLSQPEVAEKLQCELEAEGK